MKLTFKKQPKETGLASIGYPNQSVDIKVNKKLIGVINAPNWLTKDNKFSIMFSVESNETQICPWKWVQLKLKFECEKEARIWIKANINQICEELKIYPQDP